MSDYEPEQENERRWWVTITYRTDAVGPFEVDWHIEEISELHDIVERGPDWNTIIDIVVRLNPLRVTEPDDTIEASLKR